MEKEVIDFEKDRTERNFRKLYDRYNPVLFRIVFSTLAFKREEAEDAVQETWLIAIRKLNDFKGLSTFKTWLIGIAINKCREIQRKSKVFEELDDVHHPPVISGIGIKMDIKDILNTMPNGYRQVLVLHDVYVMRAYGKYQHNLSKSPYSDGGSSWSPDGKNILFHSDEMQTEHTCLL